MHVHDSEQIINRFIGEIKLFWQVIFLFSVVIFGVSFFEYMSVRPSPRLLSYFPVIDRISFAIAIILVISVFYYKRKHFSLRYMRQVTEKLTAKNPQMDEIETARRLTQDLRSKLRIIWLMGGMLVLVGVIFYWWTLTTMNMNVYFIVGLYSLLINYPRKDMFADIPYLIHEIIKEQNTER